MKIHKIGQMVYCVSKRWKGTKNYGAQVVAAKIVGYQNFDGNVVPIIKSGKVELNPLTNYIFTDIEDAVNKIKTK